MSNHFKITDTHHQARLGELTTAHGTVQTPFFMTVATCGAIKGAIMPSEIKELGAQVLLSNTYHLHLRPGEELVKNSGGLHKFLNWNGPILTDSGGFQAFSLSKLNKIDEDGITFKSHIDGQKVKLTPEKVIDIQHALGVDIMMILDECTAAKDAKFEYVHKAMLGSNKWAKRALDYFKGKNIKNQLIFAITHGANFSEIWQESAQYLKTLDFDGFAIGDLGLGETLEVRDQMVQTVTEILPEDKPRYLMGIGKPIDIIHGVRNGVDMFDCVIPTRNARHGSLFLRGGETLRVKAEKNKNDFNPVDPNCECPLCQNYSRAYLRHLFFSNEMLAFRLASLHNLNYYFKLIERIKAAIKNKDNLDESLL